MNFRRNSSRKPPVEPRDSSRLLVYHRDTGAVEHKIFRDVIDYLNPGDVLVINQTRVIPARLYGVKEGTGGAIEFLAPPPSQPHRLGSHSQARQKGQARRALRVRQRRARR